MSFMVNEHEWKNVLTHADREFIKQWRVTDYLKMETHAEILKLPSGREFIVYCDGRGFIHDSARLKGGAE